MVRGRLDARALSGDAPGATMLVVGARVGEWVGWWFRNKHTTFEFKNRFSKALLNATHQPTHAHTHSIRHNNEHRITHDTKL